VGLAVFALGATVLTVLVEERVAVALLLEASNEVPERRRVVHVIERSHDDC
jgi:hypothetical protein